MVPDPRDGASAPSTRPVLSRDRLEENRGKAIPDYDHFHPLLQKKAIAKEFYNLRKR